MDGRGGEEVQKGRRRRCQRAAFRCPCVHPPPLGLTSRRGPPPDAVTVAWASMGFIRGGGGAGGAPPLGGGSGICDGRNVTVMATLILSFLASRHGPSFRHRHYRRGACRRLQQDYLSILSFGAVGAGRGGEGRAGRVHGGGAGRAGGRGGHPGAREGERERSAPAPAPKARHARPTAPLHSRREGEGRASGQKKRAQTSQRVAACSRTIPHPNLPSLLLSLPPLSQAYLSQLTGASTVPRVFVGGTCIGGGDDTAAKARSGELARLLAAAGVAA